MLRIVDSDAIDSIDDQILSELVRDGRMSYRELGEIVGLSAHAAAERVRRLVRSGVIQGFTASIDDGKLGRALEALIDIRLTASVSPDDFEPQALALAAVQDVVFVTGRFDYQVRIMCRDADDLDQTVRYLRQRAGAAVTETRIVLRASRRAVR